MGVLTVAGVATSAAVMFAFAALEPAAARPGRRRQHRPSPRWVRRRLDAADVGDPELLWRRGCRGFGIALVLGVGLAGPGGALVIGVVFGVVALLGSALSADRRARRIDLELPPALESVARSLRSGASVHEAFTRCGDDESGIGRDLSLLADASTIADGLGEWVKARPVRSVELAAAALAVGTTTGTGLARALDQFSLGLRVRSDTRAEARALSTQARASAGLLTAAPFAFLAVMAVTDTRIIDFLFGTAAGWTCLVAAFVLDAAAAIAMITMTRLDR